MDWLTFTVEALKVLVWPIALIWVLTMFRGPLQQLLEAILFMKFKWGDKEFELKVRELKKETEAIPTPRAPSPGAKLRSRVTDESYAAISPKMVIVNAWNELENSTSSALGIAAPVSTTELLSKLRSSSTLDLDKFKLLMDLYDLRNKATHIPEYAISPSTAKDYADTAHKVEQYLSTTQKSE